MSRTKSRTMKSCLVIWLFWLGTVSCFKEPLLSSNPAGCDTTPEGITAPKSKNVAKYRIEIRGNPLNYVPGEKYTVILEGSGGGSGRGGPLQAKFVGFSLRVEEAPGSVAAAQGEAGPGAGSMTLLGETSARISPYCPNLITHTNTLPKTEVQAYWVAPPASQSPMPHCVVFRGTVIENSGVWYEDDGSLSKTLCESQGPPSHHYPQTLLSSISPDKQCCACDEAKYEVTFEGLWSRHTHPKDFPSNSTWVPRFSDVIGASHTTSYRFWDYGGIASEGLKQVAERGSTRMLESELKNQSENIRTIIKARGISYPNVTGQTYAVFRVDSKHHLISLVSMIDPSPDWIVGVSGLELCLTNCSWLETATINLYPWDAGTDSGITYTSPDMPTEPRDHIRRITSTFPNDPRSPFFDPSGEEMKPLARLYLTRQRLYEKSCASLNEEISYNEACEVNEWGPWSECSVTCGTGKKTRQRFYKNEQRAERNNCNKALTKRETCHAPFQCRPSLNPNNNEQQTDDVDKTCPTTEWSSWSGCSVSCGIGEKNRFRSFKSKKNYKVCGLRVKWKEVAECVGENGLECPEAESPMYPSVCEMTEWTPWSTCSVTCGNGTRQRERQLKTPPSWHPVQDKEKCEKVSPFVEIVECQEISCKLTPSETKSGLKSEALFGGIEPKSQVAPTDHLPEGGPIGPVVDCKVSPWSSWSPCSVSCGEGHRQKIRQIIAHAKNGGDQCPEKLLRRRNCYMGPCNNKNKGPVEAFNDYSYEEDASVSTNREECEYKEWTPWSKCSASCGRNSVQQRTRNVDTVRTHNPTLCMARFQTRICNTPPCPPRH